MGKTILVIDDDSNVRESFKLALENTGYDVDEAETGGKGLEKTMDRSYDLIYLDLKMPGMDGIETLGHLRKIAPHVPVYIVTAFHSEFLHRLKSIEQDGTAFELLRKPLGIDQIRAVTRGVLEKKTLHSSDGSDVAVFKLFIAGNNPRSLKAVSDLQSTLDADFSDPYNLEIIDVLTTPEAANHYNILVTPTAIKASPPPIRRAFGDFGEKAALIRCLWE